MPKVTMMTGILLTILGVVCYVFAMQLGASKQSPTALIPTFLGIPLMLLGFLSLAKPDLKKHFMHAAVTLGLLGFLASFPMGIRGLITKGATVGPVAQLIMGILCGGFVVLCVRSFVAARKAREAQGS